MVGDRTYLVNAGPAATRRLGQAGIHPDSLSSVFVTHMHNDHIGDLFNLFWFANPGNSYGQFTQPIQIYGPGAADALPKPFGVDSIPVLRPENPVPGTKDMWNRLLDAYAHEINVRNTEQGAPVDYHELNSVRDVLPPEHVGANSLNTAPPMDPWTVFEDDRVRVSAILVPHGPVFPSLAYRFDSGEGSVTFSGDTARSDNVARVAADTDVLVHETIDVDYYAKALGGAGLIEHMKQAHTTPQDVGRVATDAHAKSVVVSHIGPGDLRVVPDHKW
ncbi:MBL fold metallo-hydrolase [Gordonia phthalatica]|uniref:MBL fold metallo-hydrolase n=1 Tax=Gordonia phthalatica TaxID=1136941 RepID=UPI000B27B965|nr:MBL fold metallo-hydrolase [Gordonia phthalatica]